MDESKEIWALVHENVKQIKKLSDSQLKTDQQVKETQQQMKETQQQMKETDRYLRKKFSELKKYVGNMGQNNGDVAETFFYQSLSKSMKLDKFSFDTIVPNLIKVKRRKNIRGEFDIVLYNSEVIVVVETKYKVHPNDILLFKEKKLPLFRLLSPELKNYSVYGAIAGMAFPHEVKINAIEEGLFVLTQGGGNVLVDKGIVQTF